MLFVFICGDMITTRMNDSHHSICQQMFIAWINSQSYWCRDICIVIESRMAYTVQFRGKSIILVCWLVGWPVCWFMWLKFAWFEWHTEKSSVDQHMKNHREMWLMIVCVCACVSLPFQSIQAKFFEPHIQYILSGQFNSFEYKYLHKLLFSQRLCVSFSITKTGTFFKCDGNHQTIRVMLSFSFKLATLNCYEITENLCG